MTLFGNPDCSKALESKYYVNIPTINYDEKGFKINIGKGYLSFFKT